MTKSNNSYILLVDDEKDILLLYGIWLTSDGYQTVSFDNPIEALNYLEKNDNFSHCSLVITDYKMPQMSGIDLIKKIREKDLNYKRHRLIIEWLIKQKLFFTKL